MMNNRFVGVAICLLLIVQYSQYASAKSTRDDYTNDDDSDIDNDNNTSKQLKLAKLYRDIRNAFKNHREQCFAEQMKKTETALGLAYTYMKENCGTNDLDTCAKYIKKLLQAHVDAVDGELQGIRCVDLTYNPILYALRQELELPDEKLLAELKAIIRQPFWDATLDLSDIYKAISDGLDSSETGCLRSDMEQINIELQSIHEQSQKCPEKIRDSAVEFCYNDLRNRIRGYFYQMEKKWKAAKCFDPIFSPIFARARYGIDMNTSSECIKTFANSEISDPEFTMNGLYSALSRRLKKTPKTDCSRSNILKSVQELEAAYRDAENCFGKKGTVTRCETEPCANKIINRLRAHFVNDGNDLKTKNCSNKNYDQLREYAMDGFRLREKTLYEKLGEFYDYPIVDGNFNPIQSYKEVFDGNSRNIYGCAKLAAIKLQKLFEDAHYDIQTCAANEKNADSLEDVCYYPIIERFRSFIKEIDSEILGCDSAEFNRLREEIDNAVKGRRDRLARDMKELGETDFVPVMDFDKMWKTIVDNLARPNWMCRRSQMERTKDVLYDARVNAQGICSDSGKVDSASRVKTILDKAQQHFVLIKKEIANSFCIDPRIFDPMLENALQAFKLPEKTLVEAVRTFGGCPVPQTIPAAVDNNKSSSALVKLNTNSAATLVDRCVTDESMNWIKEKDFILLEAQKCANFVKNDDLLLCNKAVYDKISTYFTGPERLQCFMPLQSNNKPMKSDTDKMVPVATAGDQLLSPLLIVDKTKPNPKATAPSSSDAPATKPAAGTVDDKPTSSLVFDDKTKAKQKGATLSYADIVKGLAKPSVAVTSDDKSKTAPKKSP